MRTPYSKADKVIAYLNRQYGKYFRSVRSFDELNVIQVSHEIYEKIYTLVEKEATRLASAVYKDYNSEKGSTFDAAAFVLLMLMAYNPVTKYVFKNELDRKRSRFAESLIASETPVEDMALAKRLVAAMNAQFMDDITFEVMVKAFEDKGVERVRWFTHPDDKRCKTCKDRHGKIYPIHKIPSKPHIHCRCWVEEVK